MTRDDVLHEDDPRTSLTGEKKLNAILNSLWEAVITVERDHRISSFNRGAEQLVGISSSQATGKDCREILKASFGPAQHDCPMGDLTEGVLSIRSFWEIERLAEGRRAKFPYGDIVGRTPRIRQVFDLIESVKDTDSTVLITGESGTGKGWSPSCSGT
jgi:PAS domain S-box-containing protein